MGVVSIQNVYSYKGKTGTLKEAVGVILGKASEKVLKTHLTGQKRKLQKLARVWQEWVRLQLDKPIKYNSKNNPTRNYSLWPRRDTGRLRKTIRLPKVNFDYAHKGEGSGLVHIKIHNLYGIRTAPKVADVGRLLNDQKDKSFGGWRDRAQRVLFVVMKRRLVGKETIKMDEVFKRVING